MSEIAFAAISAAAVFATVWLWSTILPSQRTRQNSLLLVGTAAGTIAGLTLISASLPRGPQIVASVIVGGILSGILLYARYHYRERLDPGQARLLIWLSALGMAFVVLNAVLDLVSLRP